MLIMPSSDKPFQATADMIASKFFNSEGDNVKTLTEMVADEAKKQELNPEEIKRLVEKTNTSASVMFLSSGGDKKASFDLASYDDVLNITHPFGDFDDEDEEEDDEDYFDDDDDDIKTASLKSHSTTKIASLSDACEACDNAFSQGIVNYKLASENSKNTALSDWFELNKNIELAKQEKTAEELSATADIDWLLAEHNNKDDANFSKFASECLAVYGDTCLPILNGMVDCLGRQNVKLASLTFVDDTAPAIQKMGSAIGHMQKCITLSKGIHLMKKAAERCKRQVS